MKVLRSLLGKLEMHEKNDSSVPLLHSRCCFKLQSDFALTNLIFFALIMNMSDSENMQITQCLEMNCLDNQK